MKVAIYLTVCLILLVAGSAQAVYTEAIAWNGSSSNDSDSGNKPYSEASYWSQSYLGGGVYLDDVHYLGIAEVLGGSLKGLSKVEIVDDSGSPDIDGTASTISRVTIPVRVLSDGAISFDWFLTGELKIVLEDSSGYWENNAQYDSSYAISVLDNVSSDSASSSDILTITKLDGVGSYITPVDLVETYDFGKDNYSAGTIIDVTLELQTSVDAGYSYFDAGTVISSDFSNSLTIGNLNNLSAVPEPASIALLLLGGIGLRKHISKKNEYRNHNYDNN